MEQICTSTDEALQGPGPLSGGTSEPQSNTQTSSEPQSDKYAILMRRVLAYYKRRFKEKLKSTREDAQSTRELILATLRDKRDLIIRAAPNMFAESSNVEDLLKALADWLLLHVDDQCGGVRLVCVYARSVHIFLILAFINVQERS